MFNWLKRLWDKGLLGGQRSSKWPAVRKAFLKEHPTCAVCGRKSGLLKPLNVHHVVPYSVNKLLELEMSNFITLCPEHHLLFGHLMSWKSFEKDVRELSAEWRLKIQNRP